MKSNSCNTLQRCIPLNSKNIHVISYIRTSYWIRFSYFPEFNTLTLISFKTFNKAYLRNPGYLEFRTNMKQKPIIFLPITEYIQNVCTEVSVVLIVFWDFLSGTAMVKDLKRHSASTWNGNVNIDRQLLFY